MSSVDSTVPPIVSPTGEMIQPGPLSYQQNTSGTHALNALLVKISWQWVSIRTYRASHVTHSRP